MEQGSTFGSGIASTSTAPPEPSSLGTTTSGDSNGDSCSACKCGGASKGSAATEGTGAGADVSGNTVSDASAVVVAPKPAVKRVVSRVKRIPDEILQDKQLAQAISQLPSNYNFEIHKTVWRLKEANAQVVALQFPEGLLMYACTIADILERFAGLREVLVLGDVTYGACCVDDLTAQALGADFLVHYGHSCLVAVDCTVVKALYVFVEIRVDAQHLADALTHNFPPETRLCLMGTIQFISSLHDALALLTTPSAHFHTPPVVPQAKPLSPGEVLGCTAPTLPQGAYDVLVFVADGRFHLEAAMIANPWLSALRYNPYDRTLTREAYDTPKMHQLRSEAVTAGRVAHRWGVILGTLGRQGNPAILTRVTDLLRGKEVFIMLLSEITPQKLSLLSGEVEAWVQVACPRLSIDWGHFFDKPVLTPFELEVAMGSQPHWKEVYPMDYYSKAALGPYGNMHAANTKRTHDPSKAMLPPPPPKIRTPIAQP